ncbi:MAG: hypothetical protein OEU92_30130, partial [Alphaproteobacteria bacterium]|nr:hypothetical protein [Alphaproteobacteria bacterium]
MTVRINGHQDQASSKRTAADDESHDHSARSDPSGLTDRDQPDRRRSSDGLAIGAPLTAAFIGGFLVIENLAGAEQPEEGASANGQEEALLLQGESVEPSDELAAQSRTAGASPQPGEAGQRSADPAAAPSEDGAIQIAAEGGA